MVTAVYEPAVDNGEFIINEGSTFFTRARNQVFAAQNTFTKPGTHLGKRTRGAQTVTGAAVGGNTSNDTIGAVSAAAGAKAGDWSIVAIATAANAGAFEVFRPDGSFDGAGNVGVAYDTKAAGGIAFTITDGATDLAVGDRYKVTVSYAAGDGKLAPMDRTATDGTEKYYGTLVNGIQASAVDKRDPQVIRRGDVGFKRELLTYAPGSTSDEKAALDAYLDTLRIVVVSTVQ